MTVAIPILGRPSASLIGRPADRLERTHCAWLDGLRTAVASAHAGESGIWPRWNAIRYLDTFFRDQFDPERKVMNDLGPTIGGDGVRRLWAAGELVEALRWQLRHAAGLCHRADEFSSITGKLLRAVEYWCAAVEDVVRPFDWDDLPAQAREEIASLVGWTGSA
jgi:hypothetical protein